MAEDEALILLSIADDLREAGFVVFEATNADDAIRKLETHSEIRILFTDIDMPGSMDGFRLSAAVRDRWPPIKIIITSGKHKPGPEAIPAGGLFIPKPYVSARVENAIRRVLV